MQHLPLGTLSSRRRERYTSLPGTDCMQIDSCFRFKRLACIMPKSTSRSSGCEKKSMNVSVLTTPTDRTCDSTRGTIRSSNNKSDSSCSRSDGSNRKRVGTFDHSSSSCGNANITTCEADNNNRSDSTGGRNRACSIRQGIFLDRGEESLITNAQVYAIGRSFTSAHPALQMHGHARSCPGAAAHPPPEAATVRPAKPVVTSASTPRLSKVSTTSPPLLLSTPEDTECRASDAASVPCVTLTWASAASNRLEPPRFPSLTTSPCISAGVAASPPSSASHRPACTSTPQSVKRERSLRCLRSNSTSSVVAHSPPGSKTVGITATTAAASALSAAYPFTHIYHRGASAASPAVRYFPSCATGEYPSPGVPEGAAAHGPFTISTCNRDVAPKTGAVASALSTSRTPSLSVEAEAGRGKAGWKSPSAADTRHAFILPKYTGRGNASPAGTRISPASPVPPAAAVTSPAGFPRFQCPCYRSPTAASPIRGIPHRDQWTFGLNSNIYRSLSPNPGAATAYVTHPGAAAHYLHQPAGAAFAAAFYQVFWGNPHPFRSSSVPMRWRGNNGSGGEHKSNKENSCREGYVNNTANNSSNGNDYNDSMFSCPSGGSNTEDSRIHDLGDKAEQSHVCKGGVDKKYSDEGGVASGTGSSRNYSGKGVASTTRVVAQDSERLDSSSSTASQVINCFKSSAQQDETCVVPLGEGDSTSRSSSSSSNSTGACAHSLTEGDRSSPCSTIDNGSNNSCSSETRMKRVQFSDKSSTAPACSSSRRSKGVNNRGSCRSSSSEKSSAHISAHVVQRPRSSRQIGGMDAEEEGEKGLTARFDSTIISSPLQRQRYIGLVTKATGGAIDTNARPPKFGSSAEHSSSQRLAGRPLDATEAASSLSFRTEAPIESAVSTVVVGEGPRDAAKTKGGLASKGARAGSHLAAATAEEGPLPMQDVKASAGLQECGTGRRGTATRDLPAAAGSRADLSHRKGTVAAVDAFIFRQKRHSAAGASTVEKRDRLHVSSDHTSSLDITSSNSRSGSSYSSSNCDSKSSGSADVVTKKTQYAQHKSGLGRLTVDRQRQQKHRQHEGQPSGEGKRVGLQIIRIRRDDHQEGLSVVVGVRRMQTNEEDALRKKSRKKKRKCHRISTNRNSPLQPQGAGVAEIDGFFTGCGVAGQTKLGRRNSMRHGGGAERLETSNDSCSGTHALSEAAAAAAQEACVAAIRLPVTPTTVPPVTATTSLASPVIAATLPVLAATSPVLATTSSFAATAASPVLAAIPSPMGAAAPSPAVVATTSAAVAAPTSLVASASLLGAPAEFSAPLSEVATSIDGRGGSCEGLPLGAEEDTGPPCLSASNDWRGTRAAIPGSSTTPHTQRSLCAEPQNASSARNQGRGISNSNGEATVYAVHHQKEWATEIRAIKRQRRISSLIRAVAAEACASLDAASVIRAASEMGRQRQPHANQSAFAVTGPATAATRAPEALQRAVTAPRGRSVGLVPYRGALQGASDRDYRSAAHSERLADNNRDRSGNTVTRKSAKDFGAAGTERDVSSHERTDTGIYRSPVGAWVKSCAVDTSRSVATACSPVGTVSNVDNVAAAAAHFGRRHATDLGPLRSSAGVAGHTNADTAAELKYSESAGRVSNIGGDVGPTKKNSGGSTGEFATVAAASPAEGQTCSVATESSVRPAVAVRDASCGGTAAEVAANISGEGGVDIVEEAGSTCSGRWKSSSFFECNSSDGAPASALIAAAENVTGCYEGQPGAALSPHKMKCKRCGPPATASEHRSRTLQHLTRAGIFPVRFSPVRKRRPVSAAERPSIQSENVRLSRHIFTAGPVTPSFSTAAASTAQSLMAGIIAAARRRRRAGSRGAGNERSTALKATTAEHVQEKKAVAGGRATTEDIKVRMKTNDGGLAFDRTAATRQQHNNGTNYVSTSEYISKDVGMQHKTEDLSGASAAKMFPSSPLSSFRLSATPPYLPNSPASTVSASSSRSSDPPSSCSVSILLHTTPAEENHLILQSMQDLPRLSPGNPICRLNFAAAGADPYSASLTNASTSAVPSPSPAAAGIPYGPADACSPSPASYTAATESSLSTGAVTASRDTAAAAACLGTASATPSPGAAAAAAVSPGTAAAAACPGTASATPSPRAAAAACPGTAYATPSPRAAAASSDTGAAAASPDTATTACSGIAAVAVVDSPHLMTSAEGPTASVASAASSGGMSAAVGADTSARVLTLTSPTASARDASVAIAIEGGGSHMNLDAALAAAAIGRSAAAGTAKDVDPGGSAAGPKASSCVAACEAAAAATSATSRETASGTVSLAVGNAVGSPVSRGTYYPIPSSPEAVETSPATAAWTKTPLSGGRSFDNLLQSEAKADPAAVAAALRCAVAARATRQPALFIRAAVCSSATVLRSSSNCSGSSLVSSPSSSLPSGSSSPCGIVAAVAAELEHSADSAAMTRAQGAAAKGQEAETSGLHDSGEDIVASVGAAANSQIQVQAETVAESAPQQQKRATGRSLHSRGSGEGTQRSDGIRRHKSATGAQSTGSSSVSCSASGGSSRRGKGVLSSQRSTNSNSRVDDSVQHQTSTPKKSYSSATSISFSSLPSSGDLEQSGKKLSSKKPKEKEKEEDKNKKKNKAERQPMVCSNSATDNSFGVASFSGNPGASGPPSVASSARDVSSTERARDSATSLSFPTVVSVARLTADASEAVATHDKGTARSSRAVETPGAAAESAAISVASVPSTVPVSTGGDNAVAVPAANSDTRVFGDTSPGSADRVVTRLGRSLDNIEEQQMSQSVADKPHHIAMQLLETSWQMQERQKGIEEAQQQQQEEEEERGIQEEGSTEARSGQQEETEQQREPSGERNTPTAPPTPPGVTRRVRRSAFRAAAATGSLKEPGEGRQSSENGEAKNSSDRSPAEFVTAAATRRVGSDAIHEGGGTAPVTKRTSAGPVTVRARARQVSTPPPLSAASLQRKGRESRTVVWTGRQSSGPTHLSAEGREQREATEKAKIPAGTVSQEKREEGKDIVPVNKERRRTSIVSAARRRRRTSAVTGAAARVAATTGARIASVSSARQRAVTVVTADHSRLEERSGTTSTGAPSSLLPTSGPPRGAVGPLLSAYGRKTLVADNTGLSSEGVLASAGGREAPLTSKAVPASKRHVSKALLRQTSSASQQLSEAIRGGSSTSVRRRVERGPREWQQPGQPSEQRSKEEMTPLSSRRPRLFSGRAKAGDLRDLSKTRRRTVMPPASIAGAPALSHSGGSSATWRSVQRKTVAVGPRRATAAVNGVRGMAKVKTSEKQQEGAGDRQVSPKEVLAKGKEPGAAGVRPRKQRREVPDIGTSERKTTAEAAEDIEEEPHIEEKEEGTEEGKDASLIHVDDLPIPLIPMYAAVPMLKEAAVFRSTKLAAPPRDAHSATLRSLRKELYTPSSTEMFHVALQQYIMETSTWLPTNVKRHLQWLQKAVKQLQLTEEEVLFADPPSLPPAESVTCQAVAPQPTPPAKVVVAPPLTPLTPLLTWATGAQPAGAGRRRASTKVLQALAAAAAPPRRLAAAALPTNAAPAAIPRRAAAAAPPKKRAEPALTPWAGAAAAPPEGTAESRSTSSCADAVTAVAAPPSRATGAAVSSWRGAVAAGAALTRMTAVRSLADGAAAQHPIAGVTAGGFRGVGLPTAVTRKRTGPLRHAHNFFKRLIAAELRTPLVYANDISGVSAATPSPPPGSLRGEQEANDSSPGSPKRQRQLQESPPKKQLKAGLLAETLTSSSTRHLYSCCAAGWRYPFAQLLPPFFMLDPPAEFLKLYSNDKEWREEWGRGWMDADTLPLERSSLSDRLHAFFLVAKLEGGPAIECQLMAAEDRRAHTLRHFELERMRRERERQALLAATAVLEADVKQKRRRWQQLLHMWSALEEALVSYQRPVVHWYPALSDVEALQKAQKEAIFSVAGATSDTLSTWSGDSTLRYEESTTASTTSEKRREDILSLMRRREMGQSPLLAPLCYPPECPKAICSHNGVEASGDGCLSWCCAASICGGRGERKGEDGRRDGQIVGGVAAASRRRRTIRSRYGEARYWRGEVGGRALKMTWPQLLRFYGEETHKAKMFLVTLQCAVRSTPLLPSPVYVRYLLATRQYAQLRRLFEHLSGISVAELWRLSDAREERLKLQQQRQLELLQQERRQQREKDREVKKEGEEQKSEATKDVETQQKSERSTEEPHGEGRRVPAEQARIGRSGRGVSDVTSEEQLPKPQREGHSIQQNGQSRTRETAPQKGAGGEQEKLPQSVQQQGEVDRQGQSDMKQEELSATGQQKTRQAPQTQHTQQKVQRGVESRTGSSSQSLQLPEETRKLSSVRNGSRNADMTRRTLKPNGNLAANAPAATADSVPRAIVSPTTGIRSSLVTSRTGKGRLQSLRSGNSTPSSAPGGEGRRPMTHTRAITASLATATEAAAPEGAATRAAATGSTEAARRAADSKVVNANGGDMERAVNKKVPDRTFNRRRSLGTTVDFREPMAKTSDPAARLSVEAAVE